MSASLDRVVTFRQGGDALGQTEDVTTRLGERYPTAAMMQISQVVARQFKIEK
jgi:hypothetical protein